MSNVPALSVLTVSLNARARVETDGNGRWIDGLVGSKDQRAGCDAATAELSPCPARNSKGSRLRLRFPAPREFAELSTGSERAGSPVDRRVNGRMGLFAMVERKGGIGDGSDRVKVCSGLLARWVGCDAVFGSC